MLLACHAVHSYSQVPDSLIPIHIASPEVSQALNMLCAWHRCCRVWDEHTRAYAPVLPTTAEAQGNISPHSTPEPGI